MPQLFCWSIYKDLHGLKCALAWGTVFSTLTSDLAANQQNKRAN